MNLTPHPRVFWMAALCAIALQATPVWANDKARYSGSDSVEPLIDAARIAFQRAHPDFKIDILSTGSSVGLRELCEKKTALAGASRPIDAKEAKACEVAGVKYVEVPVAMDAVAVIVSNKFTDVPNLKFAQLKQIYAPGSDTQLVQSWSQVDPKFPNTPVKAYGPDIKHGTFGFFLNALGNKQFTRSDYHDSKQHDETAKKVAATPGAVGFVPMSVARDFASIVRVVPIDFGAGPVTPGTDEIFNGRYAPLSRTIYLYVNTDTVKNVPKQLEFIRFMLQGMDKFAQFANLTPMQADRYKQAVSKVKFSP